MQVKAKLLHPEAKMPTRAKEGDAGYDVCSVKKLILKPGEYTAVPTGVALQIPVGVEVQVRPRSGLAVKHGIGIVNSPGTIDSGYRGEISAILINHGTEPFLIEPGMRIAQFVFNEYLSPSFTEVEQLDESSRGEDKFGSTGTK